MKTQEWQDWRRGRQRANTSFTQMMVVKGKGEEDIGRWEGKGGG
jgi:hypothetical protein